MYDVIHYAKQIALHENNASKEIKGGTLNAKKKTPNQIIQILEKDKKKNVKCSRLGFAELSLSLTF